MPWPRDADFQVACIRYEKFAKIAKLVRGDATEVARTLLSTDRELYAGRMFQFVYIDGCHLYESVKKDLEAWWLLVEDGGILAGHDYDKTHPGVIRAVDEFAVKHGLTVYLTTRDHPASWYTYKGKTPDPNWVRNTEV